MNKLHIMISSRSLSSFKTCKSRSSRYFFMWNI